MDRALQRSAGMPITVTFERLARASAGFTLIEALAATVILTTTVLGLVQVLTSTARATALARRMTVSSALAAQKLDQLRSLAWTYDAGGLPVGDSQADTTQVPELVAGGRGLTPSPPGALDVNADGYCDFLDGHGRSLGGGTVAPPDAVHVRRWSITPLPADPANALVVQVRLVSRDAAARRADDPGGVTVTTVRTRLMW